MFESFTVESLTVESLTVESLTVESLMHLSMSCPTYPLLGIRGGLGRDPCAQGAPNGGLEITCYTVDGGSKVKAVTLFAVQAVHVVTLERFGLDDIDGLLK